MRLARVGAGLAAAAVAAALVAGCGVTTPPGPSPTASPTVVPSATTPTAEVSTGPSPAPSPSTPATAVDPGLLSVIPAGSTAGLTVAYDQDTTTRVAGDPGVAADAAALAIGLYTVTGQSPTVDFAIVSVLRLRDPAEDEAWFRSYRDSYDEAACAQAGGVERHAEATIGGHEVFIGGCAGGAFTYHFRVRDGSIVVSITSVGPARLGERLAGAAEG